MLNLSEGVQKSPPISHFFIVLDEIIRALRVAYPEFTTSQLSVELTESSFFS